MRIDGRLLVDGGMADNLPVSVVREMGADIVIAVDISTPLLTEDKLTSVLSVTEQLTNFLTRRNTEEQIRSLGPQDLLIVPPLGDFSSADFKDAGKIAKIGEEAAWGQRERLQAMSREATGAAAPAEPRLPEHVGEYTIAFIDLENVITSYSIHYTKLYESAVRWNSTTWPVPPKRSPGLPSHRASRTWQ